MTSSVSCVPGLDNINGVRIIAVGQSGGTILATSAMSISHGVLTVAPYTISVHCGMKKKFDLPRRERGE